MTATIVRAALNAIEHSGPADWAFWLATGVSYAVAAALALGLSWKLGTVIGERLGRRGA